MRGREEITELENTHRRQSDPSASASASGRIRTRTRSPCPCTSFSTSEKVISALTSAADAKKLIEWIEGDIDVHVDLDLDSNVRCDTCNDNDNDKNNDDGDANAAKFKFQKIPSSSYRSCTNANNGGSGSGHDGSGGGRCPNRVGAAYCILNAIRDACRDFLEDDSMCTMNHSSSSSPTPDAANININGGGSRGGGRGGHNHSVAKGQKMMSQGEISKQHSYEEAFPTLSVGGGTTSTSFPKARNQSHDPNNNTNVNILKPRKKKTQKKKSQGAHQQNQSKQQQQQNAHMKNSISSSNIQIKGKTSQEVKTKAKRRIKPTLLEPLDQDSFPSLSRSVVTATTTSSTAKATSSMSIHPNTTMLGTSKKVEVKKIKPNNNSSVQRLTATPKRRIRPTLQPAGTSPQPSASSPWAVPVQVQVQDPHVHFPTLTLASISNQNQKQKQKTQPKAPVDGVANLSIRHRKDDGNGTSNSVNSNDPMSRAMSMTSKRRIDNDISQDTTTNGNIDPMSRVMSSKLQLHDSPAWVVGVEKHGTFQQNQPTTSNASVTTSTTRIRSKRRSRSGTIDEATIPDDLKTLLRHTLMVYSTIIKRRMAPSISLELQLLIRLVSLPYRDNKDDCGDDVVVPNGSNTKAEADAHTSGGGGGGGGKGLSILNNLFRSANMCRIFAYRVLEELKFILVNLDKDILLSLMNLGTIVDQMPSLAKEIQSSLDARRQALLSEGGAGNRGIVNLLIDGGDDDNYGHVISGKSTIITMPFQAKRDSRHNYRSRDLTSLYNNREQSRDAFLFQLRAFQQMRGTVLNPSQIQKSLDAIEDSSRQMMHALIPANIAWFSELFTDLLLQIGLVPMQETDADILKNVSDKDKLQKLHSRFTSKVAQKNKSTKPLILRDHNEASGPSPVEYFTGHQEFFYLFIRAVDSHSFNMHLQNRIVRIILRSSAETETRGIEQRISELQLLSKFLGLIIFSPNWNIHHHQDIYDDQFFFTPVIPINAMIEEAYKEGRLIVIVPWALNFLRMITWDKISIQHTYYRESFSMLRSIHKQTMFTFNEEGYNPLATNMMIIGNQLDSFFVEVVGLNQIELMHEFTIPRHPCQEARCLDVTPIGFSKTFILSSSAHVDDLYKLVMELSINGRIRSSGGVASMKKLKPHVLSNSTSSNPIAQGYAERDPLVFGKLQLLLNEGPTTSKTKNVCVDTFFHQHKHLQQLCEFIVDFSIENELSKRISHDCIVPSVINSFIKKVQNKDTVPDPIDIDWYLTTLQAIEKDVALIADSYMRQSLKIYIPSAINALIPTDVDLKVKNIATALTINHAIRKGEALSSSLVRSEAKKVIDSQVNPHGKQLKPKPMNDSIMSLDQNLIYRIEEISNLFEDVKASFQVERMNLVVEGLSRYEHRKSRGKLIFFDSTSINVVQSLVKVLFTTTTNCTGRTKDKRTVIPRNLREVLRLAAAIGRAGFSFEELTSLGLLLCGPNILEALLREYGMDSQELLHSCVMANIMTKPDLENGLMDLLEKHQISQRIAKLAIHFVEEQRCI